METKDRHNKLSNFLVVSDCYLKLIKMCQHNTIQFDKSFNLLPMRTTRINCIKRVIYEREIINPYQSMNSFDTFTCWK